MAPPRRKTATPSTRSKTKSKQALAASLFRETPPPVLKMTDLPPELQKNVADYLTSYKDMKNLCLVCKDLQALILPYLYRTMVLRQFSMNNKLKTVLHAQNPGLKHLRRLSILTCDHRPNAYLGGELLEIIYYLLNTLPRDTLEVFDLTGTKKVAQDLVYLIRVRQRRLTTYQYHPMDTLSDSALPLADEITHVTTVQLLITSLNDCRPASTMLARLPRLSSLAIELDSPELFSGLGAQAAGARVVNGLFSQFNQSADRVRDRTLRRLRISRMCFADAGTILPTLLDCADLKHLQLVKCSHTHRLFESLSQLKLGLDSLVVEKAIDDTPGNGMIDTLLRSLHPIERLRITRSLFSDVHGDFDWSAITQHGSSLRTLEIEDLEWGATLFDEYDDYDRSLEGFRTLCKSLTKVRQISMRSPIIESPWWTRSVGLNEFLSCLANLHDLRTLKLYAWPICLGEDNIAPFCVECERDGLSVQENEAKQDAQILANKIFATLAPSCPNLGILVVECWRYSDDDGPEESRTFAFTRSMQIDAYRRVTWVGVETKLWEIKHHEPCSDIIEEEKFLIS